MLVKDFVKEMTEMGLEKEIRFDGILERGVSWSGSNRGTHSLELKDVVLVRGDGEEDWDENDKVSLEEGLKKLDEYFNNYGEGEEYWGKLKSEFVNKVKDKEGKFYLWINGYNWELMFIED